MSSPSSLTVLDRARYEPTGADWLAESPNFLTLALGPRWKDANNIVPEAWWFSNRYAELKRCRGCGPWLVLIDLGRLPQWRIAPLEMAHIYARMIQDRATQRVAFVRATPRQRQFVQLFLWTVTNARKIAFFDSLEETEAWLGKPPSLELHALIYPPSCTLVAI